MRVKGAAFTIAEILIGIVVLTILVSMATVGYQGYRDRAAMLVDETNQKILQAAVKLYAYDNNALPASLSRLRPEDVRRAYALVTRGKERYTLLAHLKEWLVARNAEAGVLDRHYYGTEGVLVCPMDRTPPPSGVSYALAEGWAEAPVLRFQDPEYADDPLIVESDVHNPAGRTSLAYRHGLFRPVSVQTTLAGEAFLVDRAGTHRSVRRGGSGDRDAYEDEDRGDREEGAARRRGGWRRLLWWWR